MDYQAVRELMKEMDASSLTLVEIEEGSMKIRFEKQVLRQTEVQAVQMPKTEETICRTVTGMLPEGYKIEEIQQVPVQELKTVCSPMVGTFYGAATPDGPPFVKAGDYIKAGRPLCIIEAMKLMNEIESEFDGEVVEVLAKNEDMVEYGQPLFRIRPAVLKGKKYAVKQ